MADAEPMYTYVHACSTGILIIPLFVVWLVSFCTVRRRADPARWPFTWMKLAYSFLVVALVGYIASDVISITSINISEVDYYDPTYVITLSEINSRLWVFGVLWESVGNIFLLLCLVEMGLSILFVWSRVRPIGHAIARGLVVFLAISLAAVSLAIFARGQVYFTACYASLCDDDDLLNTAILDTLDNLQAAFDILLWIAALAVLILAVYILVASLSKSLLRRTAALFLAIAILSFLRNTWKLAFDCTWVIPHELDAAPLYTQVLDPVLNLWPTFVILIMVFAIGCRRVDGLSIANNFSTPWQQQQQQQMYPPQPQYYLQPVLQPVFYQPQAAASPPPNQLPVEIGLQKEEARHEADGKPRSP